MMDVPAVVSSFPSAALETGNGGLLTLLLVLLTLVYLLGIARLWRRAGWGHGLPPWRVACFLAGMLILAAGLSGPVDELADGTFSIHMIQHMLLMKAVPPLLLLGSFPLAGLQAIGGRAAHWLGGNWTRRLSHTWLWKLLQHAWFAWGLFAACLWLWHAPALFDAALEHPLVHELEHLSFLGTSLLFWWYFLRAGRDRAVRYGAVVLYLFTTLLHESVLGALLTFSSRSWYPAYSAAGYWGLSPLADQQFAGTIMWLPGGVLFALLTVLYFGAWLRAIEERMQAAHPELIRTGDHYE